MVVVVALAACGGKKKQASAAGKDPPAPAATPASANAGTPAADPAPPAPVPAAAVKKHRLTLRSSPPGADVSVDGIRVGTTPVVHEVVADGGEHDFSFVLAGHGAQRYRMAPTRDGVVHATLKPLRADAGPE